MFIEFDDEVINTDFIISMRLKPELEKDENNKLSLMGGTIICELNGRERIAEEFFEFCDKEEDPERQAYYQRYEELKALLMNGES